MITPLSPHTGAEVTDVDLTQPVDGALRERLNREGGAPEVGA